MPGFYLVVILSLGFLHLKIKSYSYPVAGYFFVNLTQAGAIWEHLWASLRALMIDVGGLILVWAVPTMDR